MFHSTAQYLGSDVVDFVPQVQDGFIDIPSTPGLGVAVLENATEIRPALVQPMTPRPHKDGFIVDQELGSKVLRHVACIWEDSVC